MMGRTSMKKILLVLFSVVFCCHTIAQHLTLSQQYQMNKDVLKLIQEYGTAATMKKPRLFVHLFENENLQIYNDLLGLSTAKTLSVSQYCALMRAEAMYPSINLQNLKKIDTYYAKGRWMMELSVEKDISYTNQCGVLFSTKEFYGTYYTLYLTIAWNQELTDCKIIKLSGEIQSTQKMPDEFIVIEAPRGIRNTERTLHLLINGKQPTFNSFGQCIVPNEAELEYLGDPDMKCELITKESDCNIDTIKYTPTNMRIKPHYTLGVIAPFGSAGNSSLTTSDATFHKVGLDIGYMFPCTNRFKIGMFTGIGYSMYNLSLGLDSLNYYYHANSTADIDGDEYIRHYTFTNLSQSFRMQDLTIPVYFNFNIQLHDLISLYIDLGITNHINLLSQVTDYAGSYTTWGIYSQYSDLHLGAETGLEQFTNNASIAGDSYCKSFESNTFSMDLLSAIGMKVQLSKKRHFPLYLDIGIGYQHSIISPYKNADMRIIPHNLVNSSNALSTYTTSGGESLQSLLMFLPKISRRMLTVDVGLTYKF